MTTPNIHTEKPTQPTRPRRELKALRAVVTALDGLDPETVARVIRWALDRYKVEPIAKCWP